MHLLYYGDPNALLHQLEAKSGLTIRKEMFMPFSTRMELARTATPREQT